MHQWEQRSLFQGQVEGIIRLDTVMINSTPLTKHINRRTHWDNCRKDGRDVLTPIQAETTSLTISIRQLNGKIHELRGKEFSF